MEEQQDWPLFWLPHSPPPQRRTAAVEKNCVWVWATLNYHHHHYPAKKTGHRRASFWVTRTRNCPVTRTATESCCAAGRPVGRFSASASCWASVMATTTTTTSWTRSQKSAPEIQICSTGAHSRCGRERWCALGGRAWGRPAGSLAWRVMTGGADAPR